MTVLKSGFKVLREFKGNGIYRRYLVENELMANYAIHMSHTKIAIGDRMNTIVPEEVNKSKSYLIKIYK